MPRLAWALLAVVFAAGCLDPPEPPGRKVTKPNILGGTGESPKQPSPPPASTYDTAENGRSITVHYVGTLEDGTKFDSSRDRDEPYTFVLGQGAVIRGWDEGLVGMKVGETKKLVIPPEKGYGAQRVGKIPPNSTLVFEVELLAVN